MWWKIFAIIESVATYAGTRMAATDEMTLRSLIDAYFSFSSIAIVCLYAFNKPVLAGPGARGIFYMYIAYLCFTYGFWLQGLPEKISSGETSTLVVTVGALFMLTIHYFELLAMWRYGRGETQHSKPVVS